MGLDVTQASGTIDSVDSRLTMFENSETLCANQLKIQLISISVD